MEKIKTYNQIPTSQPHTPLLDSVVWPAQLRALDEKQLGQLANELREDLLYSVGQTGGHFGAGLGVIELTVALHFLLETPRDNLVWDVGHQTYPHKMLTGRRHQMQTMRKLNGLSGFPKRSESEYDVFGTGHSSTSISAALGMALATKDQETPPKTVAVIGDGAMTAGMAFEALHHAAETSANMLVILNDNQMSISKNSGGLANYFAKIWASKAYIQLRENGKKVLAKMPPAKELAKKTEEHMKGFVAPGLLFEEIGFNYIGPLDGHDLPSLIPALRNMLEVKGPKILHLTTVKGKGYAPAENDPVGYHAINKIEKVSGLKTSSTAVKSPKFQDVFGQWLCDQASNDKRLVGITPAMCEGSGMVRFAEQFKDQYYDVAIAEQHAVTLAAGMATEGKKPVVAIYSSFLQRGYDQLIHDVALQNLDVTFGIDRAGLVGEDGASHAGSFDIAFLRCIPNMVVACPSDENETRQLLHTTYQYPGPAAVRYPRGTGCGAFIEETLSTWEIGKSKLSRQGSNVAILNFGTLLPDAITVANNHNYSVIDMRFVKPIDETAIIKAAKTHQLICTLEEGSVMGGAGSAVSEVLNRAGINTQCINLGLPDIFVNHGTKDQLLQQCELDVQGIEKNILDALNLIDCAATMV